MANDYFVPAILAMIFCFWPTGIIALIKASNARSAMSRGDTVEAETESKKAKTWVIVSIVVGVIMIVLVGIMAGLQYRSTTGSS
ncbi:hypothetical protein ScPMuIL_016456 [Solemya velum]